MQTVSTKIPYSTASASVLANMSDPPPRPLPALDWRNLIFWYKFKLSDSSCAFSLEMCCIACRWDCNSNSAWPSLSLYRSRCACSIPSTLDVLSPGVLPDTDLLWPPDPPNIFPCASSIRVQSLGLLSGMSLLSNSDKPLSSIILFQLTLNKGSSDFKEGKYHL